MRWPKLAAGTAALALLIAGCGSGSDPRAAVARYLKQVNHVESQLSRPLAQVTQASNQFAQEQKTPAAASSTVLDVAHERSLLQSWSRIETIRDRMAHLSAPAQARHLRALFLELIDRQASLSREVARLVVFLPGFEQALRPLGTATITLERALAVSQASGSVAVSAVYAMKAAALRRFRTVVDLILGELRRLHPPAVSRPTYAAQVRSLEGMSRNARRLAAALGGGAPGNVGPVLAAFDRAASASQSAGARKAERAAARAYDAQLAALTRLSETAARVRLRLDNTLR